MEELVQLVEKWAWLIKLGGVITAVGIIWQKALNPAIKFFKKVSAVIDKLEVGYPVLEEIIDDFSKDGHCNLKEKFSKIESDMWLRRERHRLYMELDDIAIFETTDDGYCTWVSEKWMEVFNQNSIEAAGNGWLAAVNSADRDRVTHEWEMALKQKRQFQMKFRVRENGKTTTVRCTALPIKDQSGKVYGYIGKVVEINKETNLDLSGAIHD